MRIVVVLIIALAFVANADAHPGELDADGGHFYEEAGMYHFQATDGIYERNPEDAKEKALANPLIGHWVFTVVPSENPSYDSDYILEDALSLYTEGELTETELVTKGFKPGEHKGLGWRIEWGVGVLSPSYICGQNIPALAGHLAVLHGHNYFYGLIRFTSNKTVKTTFYVSYLESGRAWLNGVEFFNSQRKGSLTYELYNPIPQDPQATIKEGENLLVVKIGRGGSDYYWHVNVGFKPHAPARITLPINYEDGEVIVDNNTDPRDINGDGVVNILDLVIIANAINAPAAPSIRKPTNKSMRKRRIATSWAGIKQRR